MIPRTIWICGAEPSPPKAWSRLGPDFDAATWKVNYHTNAQIYRELTELYRVSPELLAPRHPVQWADLWRVATVWRCGGFYFDRDTELVNYLQLCRVADLQRPGIIGTLDAQESWALCAPPGTAFCELLFRRIVRAMTGAPAPRTAKAVLTESGPIQWRKTLRQALLDLPACEWPVTIPSDCWGVRNTRKPNRWHREITEWSAPK